MALLDTGVRGDIHVDALAELQLSEVRLAARISYLVADRPSSGPNAVGGWGQMWHSFNAVRLKIICP